MPEPDPDQERTGLLHESPEPDREDAEPRTECCKHCSKGKPCGDTCIDRDEICHVSPGCAC